MARLMDIYVNDSNRTVSLQVPVTPVAGSLDVTVLNASGVLVHTVNTVTGPGPTFSFIFPFALIQSEADYTVKWNFLFVEDSIQYPFSTEQQVSIVKPIIPLSQIASILDGNGDVAEVEKSVRHIIQAHTGQKFGYARKTLTVEGHGEGALRLPERLVALEGLSTLTATLNINRAAITSDGWYLKKGWSDSVTAIVSTDEYFIGGSVSNNAEYMQPGFEKYDHGHIITAPGQTGTTTPWRDDYPFRITGWWGYKTTPPGVEEAARLLVNDYACGEAAYRDRYLESIKAADWRLQFSERAWDNTGNARADYLLSEFVLAPWAVV